MSDTKTRIRRWGLDHAQLRAELELIRAQYPDDEDFEAALERLYAELKVKEDFRKRTEEPPHWE
ncbi:MAG: hypothetical protein KDB82_03740 [Planctomycetes bacterium]|nr:hypothetical protein [Planctomycetota bacterium]